MSVTHNPKVGALAEGSDWLAAHVGILDVVADRPPSDGVEASYFLDFKGATSGGCALIVNGVTTAPIPWNADSAAVLAAILAVVPTLAGHITVQDD